MTKAEIKTLIAAKIAGQGTAVDAGGALAPILNAIVDLLAELPIASAEKLGGIKVGANLNINEEGVLSAPSPGGGGEVISGTLGAVPDASGKYRFTDPDGAEEFIQLAFSKLNQGIPVFLKVTIDDMNTKVEPVIMAGEEDGDLRIETKDWYASML